MLIKIFGIEGVNFILHQNDMRSLSKVRFIRFDPNQCFVLLVCPSLLQLGCIFVCTTVRKLICSSKLMN